MHLRQNLNIYLHDPIPVVSCGYSEEGQEGHPKVPERGMTSQPLAGVCVITLCESKHSRETPTPTPVPPLPLAQENSPRSPNSSTPRAANMKNNNMKRRPRFPTWKEKKKWGGKTQKKEHSLIFFLFQTCFLLYSFIQNLNCFGAKMTSMWGLYLSASGGKCDSLMTAKIKLLAFLCNRKWAVGQRSSGLIWQWVTCGSACITVSRRALIPTAIFSNFSTVENTFAVW